MWRTSGNSCTFLSCLWQPPIHHLTWHSPGTHDVWNRYQRQAEASTALYALSRWCCPPHCAFCHGAFATKDMNPVTIMKIRAFSWFLIHVFVHTRNPTAADPVKHPLASSICSNKQTGHLVFPLMPVQRFFISYETPTHCVAAVLPREGEQNHLTLIGVSCLNKCQLVIWIPWVSWWLRKTRWNRWCKRCQTFNLRFQTCLITDENLQQTVLTGVKNSQSFGEAMVRVGVAASTA